MSVSSFRSSADDLALDQLRPKNNAFDVAIHDFVAAELTHTHNREYAINRLISKVIEKEKIDFIVSILLSVDSRVLFISRLLVVCPVWTERRETQAIGCSF